MIDASSTSRLSGKSNRDRKERVLRSTESFLVCIAENAHRIRVSNSLVKEGFYTGLLSRASLLFTAKKDLSLPRIAGPGIYTSFSL